MEPDLPSPVSHPPSQGMQKRSSTAYPPLNTFASIKKLVEFSEIIFNIKKNQRMGLKNSFLETVSLLNTKFDIYTSPTNSVTTISITAMSNSSTS
jgi:hypothetical protein